MSIYIKFIEDLKAKFAEQQDTEEHRDCNRLAAAIRKDQELGLQALYLVSKLESDMRDHCYGSTAIGIDKAANPLPGVCVWSVWLGLTTVDGRRWIVNAYGLTQKHAVRRMRRLITRAIRESDTIQLGISAKSAYSADGACGQ